MPILDIQTINGTTVGYDPNLGKFVPVDKDMLEGGTVSGLAQAAGRGAESIGLGIQQLLGSNPEATAAGIQNLEQRQQAGSNAAPWTEAVGGMAPDVLAGVTVATLTGGLGLAATMGSEGALNAMLGFIRPGDAQQRTTAALIQGVIGAVAGGVGVGAGRIAHSMYEFYKPAGEVSAAAVKGAAQGLDASEALTSRQMGAIGAELEQGAGQIRRSELGAEPGGAEAGPAIGGQGRSAGAAETPTAQLDPRTQVENEIYAADDAADMDVNNPQRMKDIQAAEGYGFTFNPGSYTKEGSGARTLEAINQAAPWREAQGMRNEAANQVLLNKQVAKAIGMKNWQQADVITPNDIGNVEADLSNQFDKVVRQLPPMRNRDIQRALMDIDIPKGNVPSDKADAFIAGTIQNIENRPSLIEPKQLMNDRSRMLAFKTKLAQDSDTPGVEQMQAAIDALDQVIDKHVKSIKNRKVLYTWEDARKKYRMLQQVQTPGAINPSQNVNATTLFRNMNRKPSQGGYGNMDIQARGKDDPVKAAYVLSVAQRINNPNRPQTGLMRIPSEMIKAGMSKAGQAAGVGGLGGAALYNTIWGK